MLGYIYLISICLLLDYSFSSVTVTEDNLEDDYVEAHNLVANDTCPSLIAKCFCDELCLSKSDCCSDYPLLNKSLLMDDEQRHILETSCIKKVHGINELNTTTHEDGIVLLEQIHAVAECPLNTPKDLARRCNRSKDIELFFHDITASGSDWISSSKGHFSVVILDAIPFHIKTSDIRAIAPVVSQKTGRVYANIDCAQCHGELKMVPGEDFNEHIRKNLKFFTVKFFCHLSESGNRICIAESTLPPSLSRPCGILAQSYRKHQSFLRDHIKWHEFLALPEKYLGFEISTEKKEEQNKVLNVIESILDILQIIVCIFSALCLCVLLIVYGKTKSLHQRLSNQLIMGLASSILSLLLIYLTLPLIVEQIHISSRYVCVTIAILIHYFFLCSFTWMSTFGISLMNTFGGIHTCQLCFSYIKLKLTRPRRGMNSANSTFVSSAMQSMVIQSAKRSDPSSAKTITLFSLLAIILPLCFTIPAIIINEIVYPNDCLNEQYVAGLLDSEVDETICTKSQQILSLLTPGFCPPENCKRTWFTVHHAFIIWFLAPTTLLLAFNCITLIIVGLHIWFLSKNDLNIQSNDRGESEQSDIQKQNRKMLKICLNLSIILGVVWIFQILTSLLPGVPIIGRIASLVTSGQGAALTFVSIGKQKSKPITTTCSWTSMFTVGNTSSSWSSSQRNLNWIRQRKFKRSSSEKPDMNVQSTNC
ncbi:unnamed protein product [Trichobilharzia szidati]|nr:unnamed protein product [Trichobilharzia szidati]